ncbi:MAG: MBL fold metallo-hydrolase [Elusimicrobia bacterium]|nr:MBL fold metallo-hydrolase [Elusimicrobiota bacterium]
MKRNCLLTAIVTAFLGFNLSAQNISFDPLNSGTANIKDIAVPEPAPVPVPPSAGDAVTSSSGALHAYFVDVGQGDCEYIELPNGKNALIDGGPKSSASSGIAQFLTQHGVTKIDYVVLTHPHFDHYSGLKYVFKYLQVNNFYDTREENTGSSTMTNLRAQISTMGVSVSYPAAGDSLDWDPGEVQVKVLNSCSEPGSSNLGPVLNDCSIVLKVTYHNTSILYTGDMQSDVEATLVSTYGSELQSDVLKVGHHGSPTATSAAFLNMVKPKIAYIELGANNTYGFPSQAVLTGLQAAGAEVYRTDLSGTQEYSIQ